MTGKRVESVFRARTSRLRPTRLMVIGAATKVVAATGGGRRNDLATRKFGGTRTTFALGPWNAIPGLITAGGKRVELDRRALRSLLRPTRLTVIGVATKVEAVVAGCPSLDTTPGAVARGGAKKPAIGSKTSCSCSKTRTGARRNDFALRCSWLRAARALPSIARLTLRGGASCTTRTSGVAILNDLAFRRFRTLAESGSVSLVPGPWKAMPAPTTVGGRSLEWPPLLFVSVRRNRATRRPA